jgi:hypothetical protein
MKIVRATSYHGAISRLHFYCLKIASIMNGRQVLAMSFLAGNDRKLVGVGHLRGERPTSRGVRTVR